MPIHRRFLLRMRNISDELVQKIKTHFLGLIFFFGNRALYEVKGKKNIIERCRPHMTIWRMRIAFWIPKATNTLRILNTYSFPSTTMVARKRHIVTL